MNFSTFLAASETTKPVYETAYSDATVPVITIVLAAFCMVLIIGLAIAGFMYLREHVETWGNALFTGILFCLAGYVMYYAIVLVLSNIPAVAKALTENQTVNSFVSCFVLFLTDCLAMFLGVWFLRRQHEHKDAAFNLGIVVIYGFTFYVITALINQRLTYYLEVIMYAIALNSTGFDTFVSSVVSDEVTLDQAVQAALTFVNMDGVELLLDALNWILKAILQIIQAVVAYAILAKGAKKIWWLLFVGTIGLFYVGDLVFLLVELPSFLQFLGFVVLTAVSGFLCWKLVQESLKDELNLFKFSRSHRSYASKNKQTKLPTINMPKD